MRIQVAILVVTLAASGLGEKLPSYSQGSKEVLSRTVSIKTPERERHTISHFLPAEHLFEASSSVNIAKAPAAPRKIEAKPKLSTPTVIAVAQPKPVPAISLRRTVSVKTPERVSNVIAHFTPVEHRYEAEGSVVIDRGAEASGQAVFRAPAPRAPAPAPAPVRRVPAPAPAVRRIPAAAPAPSRLALTRKVTVKTPERKSSVISHFTPADHRYEAEGSVTITRGSDGPSRALPAAPKVPQFVAKPATPAPVRRVPAPAPAPAVRRTPAAAPAPSGLALTRKVTVKTPERKSSVISHFTPADHRYEAEGSVTITRGSDGPSRALPAAPRVPQFVAKPATPAPVRRVPAPAPAPAVRRTPVAAPAPSGLALTRKVTVKTPERKSSVISHFTPADHRYEAEGSVTITRGSDGPSRALPAAPRVPQFVAKPATPAPVRRVPAPAPAVRRTPVAAPAPSGLALTRKVTVKTPERKSSVISHFTPADHRYEAEGSVTITRGSDGPSRALPAAPKVPQFVAKPATPAPVRRVPAPAPAPAVRRIPAAAPAPSGLALTRKVTVKTPERKSSVISHFTPADHRYEAEGSVTITRGSDGPSRALPAAPRVPQFVAKPATPAPVRRVPAPAPAPAVRRTPVAAPAPSGLALTRKVTVKTPERKSSVISHFTPADHRYEAEGSVTITRGSDGPSRALPAAPRVTQFVAKPATPAPVRRVPAPAPAPAVRRTPVAAPAASGLALTRKVTVKTPERDSDVISHFTPADHRYEAEGSVTITKSGSSSAAANAFRQASAGASKTSSTGSFSQALASASRQAGGSVSTQAAGSGAVTLSSVFKSSSAQESSQSAAAAAAAAERSRAAAAAAAAAERSRAEAAERARAAAAAERSRAQAAAAERSRAEAAERARAAAAAERSRAAAAAAAASASSSSSSSSSQRTQSSSSSSARESSGSFTYRLAEPSRGGSSVTSADLRAEMEAFRANALKSGVKIDRARQEEISSGSDPYNFSVRVEDHENTNFQSRDEWVGADGITYGWYTVLLPDAYLYNYTYTAHPVKGFKVEVHRLDSGIAMEQVDSDIYAPATIFSNQGVRRFEDFAISGVNNDYESDENMSYEVNAAATFADSLAEASQVDRSSSSSSRPVVASGPASHLCGFRLVREHGSGGSTSRAIAALPCGVSSSSSGARSSGASAAGVSSSAGFVSRGSGASRATASAFSSGSAAQSSGASFSGISSKKATASSASARQSVSSSSSQKLASAFTSTSGSSSTSSSASAGSTSFSASSGSAGAGSFKASSGSAGAGSFKASSGSAGASSFKASSGSAGASSFKASSGSVGASSFKASSGSAGAGSFKASSGSVGAGSFKASSGSAGASSFKASSGSAGAGSFSAIGSSSGFGGLRTSSFDDSGETGFFQIVSHSSSDSGEASDESRSAHRFASASSSRASGAGGASSFRGSSTSFSGSATSSGASSGRASGTGGASSSSAFRSSSSGFSTGFRRDDSDEGGVSDFFDIVSHSDEASDEFGSARRVFSTSGSSGTGSSAFRSSSSGFSTGFRRDDSDEGGRSDFFDIVSHSDEVSDESGSARRVFSTSGSSGTGSSAFRASSSSSTGFGSSHFSSFGDSGEDSSEFFQIVGHSSIESGEGSGESRFSGSSGSFASGSGRSSGTGFSSGTASQRFSSSSSSFSSSSGTPSDLSLTRTVSIKTPERKSNVISHFTPADLRFEAQGSVTINKQSEPRVQRVFTAAPAAPAATAAPKAPAKLALTRTVSVKTPERVSDVISHFSPAEHVYEATGHVTIERSSA